MSYHPVPNTTSTPQPNSNIGLHTIHSMHHDSKEDIELRDVGLQHAHYSDHSHSAHTYTSEHKSSAIHLAREHQSRQNTPRGRIHGIIRKMWLTGFMPAVALAYLALCYAAATRVIPIRIWMVEEPGSHLSTIKAGVTTINIVVIGLALLPLKSLLDDLKGEEFFRALRVSRSGVPLKAINNVSTPSHSYSRGMMSIMQNHVSKYYTGAILTGLLATLVSSLAPAALSVGIIPVDTELTAFRVGAVASDSVVKVYLTEVNNNPKFNARATEAASMGWVQSVLGVSMSFQATSLKYGVPVPLDLHPNDRARYITDVIVMDPVCTWTVPNPPVVAPLNSSDFNSQVNISLPDFGVSAEIKTSLLRNVLVFTGTSSRASLNVLSEGISPLSNISSNDPPTTGVMGWLMARCKSCDPPGPNDYRSTIDMSGIPTQEYHDVVQIGNSTSPTTTELSILMCDPRLSVETREVRLDGTGKMTVMDNTGLTRQGNLHLAQTRLLVGQALKKFSSDSGPDTQFTGLGQAAQLQMFFGPVENVTLTPVLKPRPIEELTYGYSVAQQAAMRSYLSGRMSSSFVPGRMQEMKLVFTSSLPHVVVSTILFTLAAVFINVCYLRSDTEQFTLVSVSAALANSNLGRVCEDVKYADRTQGTLPEDVVIKTLENRTIPLREWRFHRVAFGAGASNDLLYMNAPAKHDNTWARIPVHGPPRIRDMLSHIPGADVALGTPPQNTSFAIDTGSSTQFALTPDCIYCPTEGMYDTSVSSSIVQDPSLGLFGDGMFGGTRGSETITLGGLLQDVQSPMAFIDRMSPKFQLRFAGGHLGLFVPQSNETRRKQSVLYRLNEQGQLLNPVWGLRMGGENPQLTIGALDPNDYEGEINWVPLIDDSPKIQIDALKGYNGNAFPLPSPLNASIDTRPNQFINIYPPNNETFGVRCNGTETPSVEFSVEINGVDYLVNQTDLIRPTSGMAAPGYCNVGVMKSSGTEYTLGVTFLRSVYLAYRFPTGDCPGYYGFAASKGGPTPTSKQKPRTIPTDAASCLSFATPNSTPSPTISILKELQPSGVSKETYRVYGRPDDDWVPLRGVQDLPLLKPIRNISLHLNASANSHKNSRYSALSSFETPPTSTMSQQEQLTPFGHALAGALGGVFSNAVVYPLDTAKTRIQATDGSEKDRKGKGRDGHDRLSIIPLLVRILKEEGVKGCYGGFGASMANTFFMQYAYFFFYSFVRTTYIKRLTRKQPSGKAQQLSTSIELLLGAAAGALAQIFTLPVSVIATRQQIGKSKNAAGTESSSFIDVGREIVKEDGVTGLWAGIKPSMVLTVNPAITYGAFERIKSIMLASTNSSKLTPGKAFLVGALSKTLATVVTYPYIMAKVRLQAGSISRPESGDSSSESESEFSDIKGVEEGDLTASYAEVTKYGHSVAQTPKAPRKTAKHQKSAVKLLAKVLREDGVLGWYQGMGAQITKAVLAQALLFMLKDQFERYALVIMLFIRKLRGPKP
ncbi:Mitochondrial carrier [Rhizoctonia solani]|uniref:Mitochondrial carrier n=1 Tax=Rhizoctonia solani TaxID=456999 RepID=A0A8H7IAT0_9AGAM|nr:Mitochondrial carrier [Rhizoctonia solani]